MDAVDVDERIRQLLARGESGTAKTLLVEEFQGRVGALCRGMVGNAVLAEDLKQDTFERAFASMETFRGESSVSTWLLRIARNRCIDHLRAGESRFVTPAGESVAHVPAGDERSLADVIASLQRAEHALAILEPEDRALVLLRHVHDVSYAELAETFGVKEGALRMRVSRALEAMRTSLEREDARIPTPASESMAPPKRRGVLIPRAVLWVTLATLVGAFVGIWYGVIVPQREAAAALRAQIETLQQEQQVAERALAAAQSSGASEAELQRLRDALATAQQAASASASGSVPEATLRSVRARTGTTSTSPATSTGGCMGPLCALMRN